LFRFRSLTAFVCGCSQNQLYSNHVVPLLSLFSIVTPHSNTASQSRSIFATLTPSAAHVSHPARGIRTERTLALPPLLAYQHVQAQLIGKDKTKHTAQRYMQDGTTTHLSLSLLRAHHAPSRLSASLDTSRRDFHIFDSPRWHSARLHMHNTLVLNGPTRARQRRGIEREEQGSWSSDFSCSVAGAVEPV
jgi:hypothetical protein